MKAGLSPAMASEAVDQFCDRIVSLTQPLNAALAPVFWKLVRLLKKGWALLSLIFSPLWAGLIQVAGFLSRFALVQLLVAALGKRFAWIGPATGKFKDFPWQALWDLNKDFWFAPSPYRRLAWFLLATIIVLLVANIELGVATAAILGKLADSFQPFNRSLILFWTATGALAVILQQAALSFGNGQRVKLNLLWRDWRSRTTIDLWYDANGRPYHQIIDNPELKEQTPNPEFVIVQDSTDMPNVWTNLAWALVESGLSAFNYSIILLSLNYAVSGFAVFWVLVSYVVVSALGKSLFALKEAQFQGDADLKVEAGRARTDSESIAFGHGEQVAKAKLLSKLAALIDTWLKTMIVNRWLQLFQGSWSGLIPFFVPVMLITLQGHVTFGVVVSITAYFAGFYKALNVLPDQLDNIASLTQILVRMNKLVKSAESCRSESAPGEHIQVIAGRQVAFNNVTIQAPDSNEPLWRELTFTLNKGRNLLVVSSDSNAAALTSLLETVVGLTNKGSGTIMRPSPDKVMYLTAKPDLPKGTLRQALSHPRTEPIADDVELLRILEFVGLARLAERQNGLDGEETDWRAELEKSKEDQHRLVLARILLHKPEYLLVDAAGLDQKMERKLYLALRLLKATVLTTGAATTELLRYHDCVLERLADGTAKPLCPASGYQASVEKSKAKVPANEVAA